MTSAGRSSLKVSASVWVNVKFADTSNSLLPRFLAREKFEQLITRPTHIKGGEQQLYFASTASTFCSYMVYMQISVIVVNVESVATGLIDHVHLRLSERKLRTIVTQESHYYTDHDSVNITFKNF